MFCRLFNMYLMWFFVCGNCVRIGTKRYWRRRYRGGKGSSPKFWIFSLLRYVHLSLNSERWPRYGRWREQWFDLFWRVCVGYWARKISKSHLYGQTFGRILGFCHKDWQVGSSDGPLKSKGVDFEIFHFSASCTARKVWKSGQTENVDPPPGTTGWKIEIFRIPA